VFGAKNRDDSSPRKTKIQPRGPDFVFAALGRRNSNLFYFKLAWFKFKILYVVMTKGNNDIFSSWFLLLVKWYFCIVLSNNI
jgi:hypothetical protein